MQNLEILDLSRSFTDCEEANNFLTNNLSNLQAPNLKTLILDDNHLRNNQLTLIFECRALKSIKVLSVRNNEIGSIIAPFSDFKELPSEESRFEVEIMRLEVLDVSYNRISKSKNLPKASNFLNETLVINLAN